MQLRSAKVVQDLKTGYVTLDFGARARGTFISAPETVLTQSTWKGAEFKRVLAVQTNNFHLQFSHPCLFQDVSSLLKNFDISSCSFKKVIPRI